MREFHVAGSRSGAGKTTLVCALIEALEGWGALKTSTHAVDATGHGPPGLTVAPQVLAVRGTDTARYLDHGAARVAWLRATPETLPRDLPGALATFADLPGVIVEGNSPWISARGDRLILVFGRGPLEAVKRSTEPLAIDADLVVLDANEAPAFDVLERYLDQLAPNTHRIRADLQCSDDPGRRETVRRVVTWTRG